MIPFNLEKALAGEKVVTRDGREVTQLHVFTAQQTQTLYGVMQGTVEQWNCLGQYHAGENVHSTNLFMAPKKLSGFVNVYDDGRHGTVHKTRTAADEWAEDMPRDCIRLTCIDLSKFEEGHGL